VMYFGNPSSPVVRAAMQRGEFGCIVTPGQGNLIPTGVRWCADNGCYGKGWPGTPNWLNWIERKGDAALCAFAAAPDVVGDAKATLVRSTPLLPLIRRLGLPAAFVAQDGVTPELVPWDGMDVLFIGGTDEFKLGPDAEAIGREAKDRGKWLHMGRVNSIKRLRIAKRMGCDSVDGTYLSFGPDKNTVRMRRFLDQVLAEP
jgi:hypothetical protein